MLYIGNTKYRVYSGENRVSIKSPILGNDIEFYDYLQNDGVAYIDTGYIPNVNTKIETKFLSFIVSPVVIYSSIEKGKYIGDFRLFWYSPNLAAASGGERSLTNHSIIANNIYTTVHSNNSLTINGNYFNTGAGNNFSDTLLLMADRFNSAYYFNGRFYYCRVWENDVLVRDFVPCQYKGQYGMWDLVNNEFYGNANSSGAFTVGGEIKYYDYLESDGIAYIVTDYIPNDTSGILVTANCATTSGNNQVVGVRQASTGDNRWWVNFSSTLEIGWNTWKTTNISKNEYQNNWVTVENNYLNSRLGKVDGVTKRTDYPTLVNITYPAYIFVGNSGGIPFNNGNFIGKIKNIKFSEGTTIVRDFKPCLYNNQAGLWDSVECKFYGNANNTGTLTVGNDS